MLERLCVLVVDDEPPARALLRHFVARQGALVVGEAADGAKAVALASALRPDLVLLDIAMPGMDGMEAAREMAGLRAPPAIIFCTAYDGFAVAAFDLRAADYLLKPVEESRLVRALARVAELRRVDGESIGADYLWVPDRADLVRVEASAVERVDAERDYVRVHIGGRSHLLRATMEEMSRRLDPARFLRLHRSTIVRRDRIAGMRHEGGGVWSALLVDGGQARIGRSYLEAVRALAR